MSGEAQRLPRREESPPPIPGYEILGFIGRGSSGVVYRARQQAVDREVAIKILHPHLARDSRIVRRLQREARTTARLAHPHIVSAVDMGEVDGRWWYAMEFVDGPSLSQRLRSEGRIREREALRLFIPLGEALEHLYEHGVVHRDIKPANILIERTGGARLADLGLAVAEDDPSITGTGGTLGTPHYISPEQAVDPRQADVRSDIWSFGATLFHAVCGRPPFSGESAAEVLSGVLYSPIPDPCELEPTLSTRLALVLRKCLARDPARRYAVPHDLLLDLERVRERRAPRVARRELDPVLRRGDRARRFGLLAGVGLLFFLAGAAVLLARLAGRRGASSPTVAHEAGPFEPLAELALRRERGLARPAEVLGELQQMDARIPAQERAEYEQLVRAADSDLRRILRALRTELEDELDAEIARGDLAAGWRTLDEELEPRFLRATGYGLEGLASVGTSLGAWRDRLALTLEAATDMAISELEALLVEWRGRRLSEVENGLAQQDWDRSLSALRMPDAQTVFAEAGFGMRVPEAAQAGLLEGLAADFRLRAERLEAEWQALDHELRDFVLTRAATLERQLRESPPRIAAEGMLRGDFERELFDRRLSRERMPAGLSRAALEQLEASARELAGLEESLREADARADFAEIVELADDALARRDFARGLSLWEDARERLVSGPRFESSPARAELARRAEVHAAEARALDGLLERACEGVRRLDGQRIELRWGSILYSNVRIEAGADPRQDGFRADSIAGVLRVEELPSSQFEAFAGLGAEAELSPEDRLSVASFRFHDGRAAEAQRVLFSGSLPLTQPWSEVASDLAARIAFELERGEARAGKREEEARRLMEGIFDPEFLRQSPRVAQARVTRLLGELADVPFVRQQRAEILRVRSRLEESAPQDVRREFQRVFAPDELELVGLSRVRLRYTFGEGRMGAWEAGEWRFDGLGLALAPEVSVIGWDQLAAERGLRLLLKTPMVTDNLELVLRFEALQGETPGRLLWVSVGGFQVAFLAADLPGATGEARWLVGTEERKPFLQRLLDGEGRLTPNLIAPGTPPRELRFKALRRSGRFDLVLDGVTLGSSAGLKAPPGDSRALTIRSWGSVRILAVTLEAGR